MLAKGGFVGRAQRQVDQLRTRVEEASPPSGGQQRQLLAKLEAPSDSLKRADNHIHRSKPETANNMLNAASRQLGAVINAVEADWNGNGRNGMSEGHRIAFVEAASDSIGLLSAARNTSI